MPNINFNDPRFQEALLKKARSSPQAVRSTRGITGAFVDSQIRRKLQRDQLGLQSQLMKARIAEGQGRLDLARGASKFNQGMAKDRLALAKKTLGIQTLMGLGGMGAATWIGHRQKKAREVELAKQEQRDANREEQLALMRRRYITGGR